jgi:hypothetical protein
VKTLCINLRHLLRGRPRPKHAAAESQRSGFHINGWFIPFAELGQPGRHHLVLEEARHRAQVNPIWPL